MIALPLLERREIEVSVIAPLIEAFAAEVGDSRAREILTEAIGKIARTAGCDAAALHGANSLAHLKHVVESWKFGGALEIDLLRDDDAFLEFNVTRCLFAEMYHRLGLAHLGPLLSCNRDGTMIEGFNPAITFRRTQTIMQGASYCDFRYELNPTTDPNHEAKPDQGSMG